MKIVKVALVLLFLAGAAFAACPNYVICDRDGASMFPDGNMRMVVGHQEREYMHMAREKDQSGQWHEVPHKVWVACD